LPLAKSACRPPAHTQRPARLATAAGLSLDRTGNGRPRDLVKRWGRPWVVPFPKQKCRQAKLAGVKVGRSSIASPSNTSACNLPPRGPTDLSHAGTAIDSFRQSASCQFAASTLKRGAASQGKTHMKNTTANAATASVIATAATIRKSSSIGGLPAAMSVRRIQS
jgi:hypothetical protein